MVVPLLAGAAKTMVISMLSEKVVLRVMLMLAEWAAARSTNSLDDKIVTEIRGKLSGWETIMRIAYFTADFHYCIGAFMAEMITPNFSRAEMRCKCGTCKRDEMDPEFMRMLQELRDICGPLK